MMNNVKVKVKQPDFDKFLARLNLSRGKLAELVGVNNALISRIANKQEAVSAKTRSKLLDVLGCSFDDIFFIKILHK